MTFGDSLLQALGTGLCERSVPPIHSRRSRLCGPAAHSRALVRSLRMLGRRLEIGLLLTELNLPSLKVCGQKPLASNFGHPLWL